MTNFGNENQSGRGMRHTAGTADSAADHIDLIPTVLKQAEAFDAVGFGYKLLDESNHLFPWKAMDAVEYNRVGTQLGGQACSPSSVEWDSRSFSNSSRLNPP